MSTLKVNTLEEATAGGAKVLHNLSLGYFTRSLVL